MKKKGTACAYAGMGISDTYKYYGNKVQKCSILQEGDEKIGINIHHFVLKYEVQEELISKTFCYSTGSPLDLNLLDNLNILWVRHAYA